MGATTIPLKRRAAAFALALLACAAVGSVAQTQFNLGDLSALGVEIPFPVRAQTTVRDLAGFAPLYALVVAVGLLPAFIVAGLLSGTAGSRRAPLYLLAGGVAVWASLQSANALAGVPVLVFATRHAAGLACLVAGGVLAGWIYQRRTR
ncbi:MAG TPA: hypothetical protein VLF18_12730 [Tahibacter sp.]|uniref:hypothetical protein n=1 Tax=Tahibacter sp. TaxID=2056211 RepID=UPI002B7F360D|nr:hypothetical protein [Tahibacter sp.]HSX61061.1 hypothetical protein [Tahibacter sp.]